MNFSTFDRSPDMPRMATALAVLLVTGTVNAAPGGVDEGGPAWHLSGYGTLGVAHADTDQADFVASVLKAHGAGHTDRWSPNVDSKLGAQVRVDVDARWSAVLQVIAEQGMDRTYRPKIEWANIKYQITPNLSVRLGRIALPMFLAADYRKVGYAHTFVRTPLEVYNSIPISHSDGIDASYRWRSGALKHSAQLSYGRHKLSLIDDYTLDARHIAGFTYSAEMGALSVRISGMNGRLSTNIGAPLFDGLRQFGPIGNALSDKYSPVNARATGVTVGTVYDPGNWYVMGEAGRMDGRSMLVRTHSAYLSAGYRHQEFTPYAIFAWTRADEPTRADGVPTAGLPPQYAAAAGMLNQALNYYLGTVAQQSTITAGVRWDFRPNVALKLQYEHLRPRPGSRGTLINDQPGFRDGRTVNVASAVFDFVF